VGDRNGLELETAWNKYVFPYFSAKSKGRQREMSPSVPKLLFPWENPKREKGVKPFRFLFLLTIRL
jgi:hypothetical protein